jgi:hypothetical protein
VFAPGKIMIVIPGYNLSLSIGGIWKICEMSGQFFVFPQIAQIFADLNPGLIRIFFKRNMSFNTYYLIKKYVF